MEMNKENTKASSKDVYESTRASLELLCSTLTRQYLSGKNNSSTSYCDIGDNVNTPRMEPATAQDGNANLVVGGEITLEHINTLRELQETLRAKDEKVAELRALLVQRDAVIQELRRKLDMYRNLLPLCSPYGRFTKHRPQGDF